MKEQRARRKPFENERKRIERKKKRKKPSSP
jgi:hypothetical protein